MSNSAKYPGSIVTTSDLLEAGNRQSAYLSAAITSGATTIPVVGGAIFLAPCVVTIDSEIILISGSAPTSLTVAANGRGYDGTTPAAHAAQAAVRGNIVAWHHNQLSAEVRAIEGLLGVNGVNVGAVGYSFASYNFSRTPGGAISVGSNTVTLTPVPRGVNGTDANHRVYLSNGTGTAEAVLITGGTAVSGAASGTIIFTAANTHTGTWTIASATSGIQEAILDAPSGGRVNIPGGNYTIYALIDIPQTMSLRGAGIQNTYLTMAAGFTGRAMQIIAPSGAHGVDLGDFTISYTTNGASLEGLYMQEVSDGIVSNLAIIHSYNGITGYGVARVHYIGVNLFPLANGYNFSSNPASVIVNVSVPTIIGGYVTMNSSSFGTVIVLVPTIAGMNVIGLNTVLGSIGISAIASSGAINELNVQDCIFDSTGSYCIQLQLTGTATAGRWTISNNLLSGASGNVGGILTTASTPGNITGLQILGNKILTNSATANAINLQGVNGGVVEGNLVNSNVAGGTAVLLDGFANSNIDIKGNNLGSSLLYLRTGNIMNYGVFINSQAHSDISIHGNTFSGSVAALANNSTVANGVTWYTNTGIDDVIPAVASAATLAFPINPIFTLTGVTNVTAVSGLFKGERGKFITTGAALTFTAGATIGNTLATTQNVPVEYFFDGVKLWLR